MVTPTPGALQKIGRSRRHAHDAIGAIAQWVAVAGIDQRSEISEDRMSWTVYLIVEKGLPVDEWALIVGDAIHNARAALDIAVFELADGASMDPKIQRDIAFPIVTDSANWPQAEKRLAMLPTELLERIRQVQPLNRPENERSQDLLPPLHALDIADKHRLPLTATCRLTSLIHKRDITFEDAEAAVTEPKIEATDVEAVDGAPLFVGSVGARIAKIKGRVDYQFQVRLDVPGVGPMGVQEALDSFAFYVQQVIAFLANDASDPSSSGDAEER